MYNHVYVYKTKNSVFGKNRQHNEVIWKSLEKSIEGNFNRNRYFRFHWDKPQNKWFANTIKRPSKISYLLN